MKPFEDLKVVELASVLAGPSVGYFFAELGASVLKVENKLTGGDVTRSWKLASEDKNSPYSAYYSSVNLCKKSIFLNLKLEADKKRLIEEIENADVLLVNFKPGDAEKLALDYDTLKKINPKLIYGEITGFGKSKRTAYDIVLQAESGFLSMSGTKNGELCKMPVALIDVLAAHHLKEGILIAMLQQKKQDDKKAVKVSVSLFDTAVASLANQATNWLMAKHIPQPLGTLHPNIAPYGELFTCKDEKQIVLAIGSDKQFKAMCELLQLNLFEEDRFCSNQQRVKNREELFNLLSDKIARFEREEIMTLFLTNNVPAGAVRKLNEVFELKEAQQRVIQQQNNGKTLKAVKGNAFTFTH